MGTRWAWAELCGDYSREESCDLGSGLRGAPPITGTSEMSPGVAKAESGARPVWGRQAVVGRVVWFPCVGPNRGGQVYSSWAGLSLGPY